PAAHGDGAVHAGRDDPPPGDRDPALHAPGLGPHPGPAFGAGGRTRLPAPGRSPRAGARPRTAEAGRGVPQACRAGGSGVMLVDSHCHLDFPDFDAERPGVLARARAAGVGTMLTIGTKLSEFDRVRAIAEGDPDIWCSVGIHPNEAASEADVDAATLAALAA